jgi:cytochrome c
VIRLLISALLVMTSPAAAEEGDAVFRARCSSCHAVTAGAPSAAGPNLVGLIGRPVGGDPAFGYSPVLEAARQAGEIWDAAKLERFLGDPEEMYPGLWMGGNGLRLASERAAVTAFLQASR